MHVLQPILTLTPTTKISGPHKAQIVPYHLAGSTPQHKDLSADGFAPFLRCIALVGAMGLCLLWPLMATADIRLPGVVGHKMVLQQGKPIRIWGWASPGEPILVRFAGQTKRTTTNKAGRWQVTLNPLKVGKPRSMLLQGHNRIVLQDILVGEVWLCSGQSNMLWPIHNTRHRQTTLDALQKRNGNKDIRLFRVNRQLKRQPTEALKGHWQIATASSVRWFSAICYYFGERLQRQQKVPVGLIQSAWGGTIIEAWMPWKAMLTTPAFVPIIQRQQQWEKISRPIYLKMRAYQQKRWLQMAQRAKAARKPLPPQPPRRHLKAAWHANSPSALFNGMIYPLHRYQIRGVLWYQGESNVHQPRLYRQLFPVMIERWRWLWREQLPFLYVQIAPFRYNGIRPSAYNELCEAQSATLDTTLHTAMVVTNDLGNPRNIHPDGKREIARRLYLAAMAQAYGKSSVVYSGPLYRSMRRQKNKLLLSFKHVGGGLVAKGGKLTQFRIAGKDRRFVAAKAYIVGDHVMVWADKVPDPIAVRFAWSDTAVHHLFNQQGLPASSFRTDRWPSKTSASRRR